MREERIPSTLSLSCLLLDNKQVTAQASVEMSMKQLKKDLEQAGEMEELHSPLAECSVSFWDGSPLPCLNPACNCAFAKIYLLYPTPAVLRGGFGEALLSFFPEPKWETASFVLSLPLPLSLSLSLPLPLSLSSRLLVVVFKNGL